MATSMNSPEAPSVQPRPTTPHIHQHGVAGLSNRSKDQQWQHAHDVEWKVVAPMPTDQFLDKFFPSPPDLEVESKTLGFDYDDICFASVPDSPAREEEMYKGLVRVKLSFCHPSNQTNFSVTISTR